jgi:rod shape determining protein RodA
MFHLLTGRLLAVRIWLLLCASALLLTGLATLYAIGHPADTSGVVKLAKVEGLFQRQVWFALVGLGGFVAVNWVNYRDIGQISGWLLAAVMVLLAILVVSKIAGAFGRQLPFAPQSNNVYQWIVIRLGHRTLATFQPSEFCKLAYIVTLAWYLRYRSNYRNLESLVGPFVLTLLPVTLILAEPDLGTVILLMGILFLMLFVAGARLKHLGTILLMALVLSPLLWCGMKQNQRMRVAAVLLQNDAIRATIERSPTLSRIVVGKPFTTRDWTNTGGYQLERSKNAIASGGATGYGFRQGPFIKYDFLTYRESDFVFASIAHQWGFVGSVGVLLLYAMVILCGLEIASKNTDPFGRLLAVGIVIMFTMEVSVNVGVTLGLMPITGLTLPLISHGGSSLVVHMMALGLLNNVGRCRPFSLARPD